MRELLKNTVILTVITLVAGILLGFVYEITKDPIAAAEAQEKADACQAVFAEADSFDTEFQMPEDSDAVLQKHHLTEERVDQVIPALDEAGDTIAYVLTVTTSEGYGGDITFMVGIRNGGSVNGISMLTISETAGLGMNAQSEEFLSQYAGKQVDQFVYSKSGASAENEIDVITGATITTNAVTNGVNAGLYYFQDVLEEDQS